MPRPTRDNPPVSAPTSAPVTPGQPASVPNRARMVTYDTGEAPPIPEINFAERMGNVVPTSNPLTGETAISTDTTDIPIAGEPTSPIPEPGAPPAPPAGQPVGNDGIPEKYRNKSPEELVKMHQEAEKAFHARDEEIRVAREYQNRFLAGQLQPTQAPPPPPPTPTLPQDDNGMLEMMLAKPTQFKEAIVKDLMSSIGQSVTKAEVNKTFNENKAVIHSPEFGQFLQTVPPAVCNAADRDPQVLNYLLNSFKQTNKAPVSPVESADKARAQAARTNDARTVSGGNTGAVSQPTFTRLQLMEMQIKDPDRYAALQPQIMELYSKNLI